MKTRRFLSFFLILVLLLSLSPAAFAAVELVTEEDTLSGEHDATVFFAGNSPVSNADVKGILFIAGNSVGTSGTHEYAFVAGNMITFNGFTARDAFVAGNSLSLGGGVGRDLVAFGNSVSLSGSVGRDVYAGGSTVFISGEIGGDVLLSAEEIQIADDAKIGGSLRYNGDAKITGPSEILAAASTYLNESEPEADTETASAAAAESRPSVVGKIRSFAFAYLGLVLLAFALLWLTPLWEKLDSEYTGADFGKYAASFGIGFGVLAGLPIAAILLMVTGIGLRPAFALLCLYIAAILAAPAILGFFLGTLLWRNLLKRPANYWIELPVGLLVLRVLGLIPGVKIAVALVTVPLGLGVLTRLLGKKKAAPAAPVLPENAQTPVV